MKSLYIKALCIVCLLLLVAAPLAACNRGVAPEGGEHTLGTAPAERPTLVPSAEDITTDAAELPSVPVTNNPLSPTLSLPAVTSSPVSHVFPTLPTLPAVTQPPGPEQPRSIEEIVTYFNRAANEAKSISSKIIRTLDKRETTKVTMTTFRGTWDMTEASARVEDSNWERTRRTTIDHIKFPVEDEIYASKLDYRGVEKASCTLSEDRSTYFIYILLKEEGNTPAKNKSYHGTVFSVTADTSSRVGMVKIIENGLKILTVRDYNLRYLDSYIQCEVDVKTGRLQKIYYHLFASTNVRYTDGTKVLHEMYNDKAYEIVW